MTHHKLDEHIMSKGEGKKKKEKTTKHKDEQTINQNSWPCGFWW